MYYLWMLQVVIENRKVQAEDTPLLCMEKISAYVVYL